MRVLLALNRSLDGAPAEEEAIERDWPAGSVVRVLTVLQDPALFLYIPEIATASAVRAADALAPAQEALNAEAATVAQSVARKSPRQEVAVEKAVRRGTPGPEIVEEAKEWSADLIGLGADARTGIERLLARNIDTYVVAHAPCSVEVVRAPAHP